jgi:hypothetical protein
VCAAASHKAQKTIARLATTEHTGSLGRMRSLAFVGPLMDILP